MNIILLNTNSFGGNYEYSRFLLKAYLAHKEVRACTVVIPVNAVQEEDQYFKKILISDIYKTNVNLFKKLYFLFRSIVNPFRVYAYLKKQEPSVVIFNDYEQITSFLWAPFFRRLKTKHSFVVILHDPDRDQYLPFKALSVYTMKCVMRIMDVAVYHEVLPDKPYYKMNIVKQSVPHGIYTHVDYDSTLLEHILNQKGMDTLLGILGNIRDEKNYTLIIKCLPRLPGVKLLIAGDIANSAVSLIAYKSLIEQLNLQDRVIWVQKRLTDAEFQSAIRVCDGILLYYKKSFTSQSGILNLIAPHKKKVFVSDHPSGLKEIVRTFNIGTIVPEGESYFVSAIQASFMKNSEEQAFDWNVYIDYASWDNHVRIVLAVMKEVHLKKTLRA